LHALCICDSGQLRQVFRTVEVMLQGDNPPVTVDCQVPFNTTLYVASEGGHMAVVQTLLQVGANVNL